MPAEFDVWYFVLASGAHTFMQINELWPIEEEIRRHILYAPSVPIRNSTMILVADAYSADHH